MISRAGEIGNTELECKSGPVPGAYLIVNFIWNGTLSINIINQAVGLDEIKSSLCYEKPELDTKEHALTLFKKETTRPDKKDQIWKLIDQGFLKWKWKVV